MTIADQFRDMLQTHRWAGKKIIVAVSGGADSMSLAYLLRQSGQQIGIAHCNFGLRGAESDADETFVRAQAALLQAPCYVQRFDTAGILASEGGNLQELARNLRYTWFEQLRLETGSDLIATAHHREDGIETMLLNFFRGTGIAGMHGIRPQQGVLIRPLISFCKQDLLDYAREKDIAWREDSSNAKTDYTRNAIRHRLLPLAGEIFPGVMENLAGNTRRFAEAALLYRESVARYRKGLIEQRKQDWYIPVRKLQRTPAPATLLRELLQPFGFPAGQLAHALQLLEAESGRYIASGSYRLIRHRDFLVITAAAAQESTHILVEAGMRAIEAPDFTVNMKYVSRPGSEALKALDRGELCVPAETLEFPLVLRPWKTGDYFYPLGMGRKKKKVSRYLIGEKVPLHEKEKVWVLESGKKIVWVVGMRADERFRVTEKTVSCCFFSVKRR